jgi:hypothetical protein
MNDLLWVLTILLAVSGTLFVFAIGAVLWHVRRLLRALFKELEK